MNNKNSNYYSMITWKMKADNFACTKQEEEKKRFMFHRPSSISFIS